MNNSNKNFTKEFFLLKWLCSFNFIFMTDDDKKKTACLFLTLPDRVKMNNHGTWEHNNENAKKYFDKFNKHSVIPFDDSTSTLVDNFADEVKKDGIDNLQVIFDIHGDKDALITDSSNLKNIIESTVWHSGAKNIEMLFANCYGSSNVREYGNSTSIHSTIKAMSKIKKNKVSTYFMPKGHVANISFTKNGDIFFISSDAERAVSKQDDLKDVCTANYYKTKDKKDDEYDLQIVHKDGCWNIPAEKYCKGGETNTNILEGIYKDRPPRKYDINVNPNKEVSTDIVPYEPSLASKIQHKLDFDLNKKNKINTTIKK